MKTGMAPHLLQRLCLNFEMKTLELLLLFKSLENRTPSAGETETGRSLELSSQPSLPLVSSKPLRDPFPKGVDSIPDVNT